MPLLRLLSRGLWPAAPVLLPVLLFSMLPAIPLSLAPGARYVPSSRGASGMTRADDVSGLEDEVTFGGSETDELGSENDSELTPEDEGIELGAGSSGEAVEELEIEEEGKGGSEKLAAGTSSAGGGAAVVKLLDLRLVHSSVVALARPDVRPSEIRFSFALSAATKVRVQLAREAARAGKGRWHALADSLALAGVHGHNRARLRAGSTLLAGVYRLTLTPLHGRARSLIIRVK